MGAAPANAEITNQDRLDRRRRYAGPTVLKEGFRPLFLAAGAWAAISVPLWICVWTGLVPYRGSFAPALWHVHEMIFGFIAAAVGGFVLTAIPNWTGRLPVRGTPLAGLVFLWLAGRIAMWFGEPIGPTAVAVLDMSYISALAFCVSVELVAGRNWRNLPILGALFLLVTANGLFHVEAGGLAASGDVAVRLSIATMAMLIGLIGGRVVPSFTRNWFAKSGGPDIAGPMGGFDRLVLVASIVALCLWIAVGESQESGLGLLAAGVLHFFRLVRWRGWRTIREPLVLILHLGYLWLGVGLMSLGASMLGDTVPATAALHVLTIGAMGTMILAVMTRAIKGHTGAELSAGAGTVVVYVLVTVALAFRVAHDFLPETELLWGAALAWTAAFGLFVWLYAPLALRRG